MSIMDSINKFRKRLLAFGISQKSIPEIKPSNLRRSKLIFSGRVQGVGFRVEAVGIAERLDLVGWVKNKSNGEVEIEVEGESNKIDYMIEYLSSIRRAPVDNVEKKELDMLNTENSFEVVY